MFNNLSFKNICVFSEDLKRKQCHIKWYKYLSTTTGSSLHIIMLILSGYEKNEDQQNKSLCFCG